LTDDEIAKQWEYNVVDPHTPKLSASINESNAPKEIQEDGDDK
jgi:GTP-binding protein